jgi:hypothetical protein
MGSALKWLFSSLFIYCLSVFCLCVGLVGTYYEDILGKHKLLDGHTTCLLTSIVHNQHMCNKVDDVQLMLVSLV